ncbi:Type III restriction-modification system methylation subunit [Chitinispirillum alkaliphilum]|nr:Type III restriction-modification system methylation subunit [Chitinispirillum alkaliphilum]
MREDAANCFYPIYIKDRKIVGFGDVCQDDFHPNNRNIERNDGIIEVYPIGTNGEERKWVFARQSVNTIFDELEPVLDKKTKIWDIIRKKTKFNYKTVWTSSKYSANSYGSRILNEIMGSMTFSYPKSIHTVKDCINASLNNSNRGIILDYFAGSGTTAHAVISLNRQDDGKRKYILVEQGEYFDTVLKPRIQKIVYSADWKEGKPTTPQTGISHAFKVIKLESYEDTLNNLELKRSDNQQNLLNDLPESAQKDYLLRYMLDIESRGSLLSVDSFKKPFDFKLKVSVDSAGASEERAVDLVETFNYLIGLRVKSIHAQYEKGRVVVEGTLPNGEKALILWRDCETVDYEELNRFCESRDINPRDTEFDVVYINGDHNIPNVLQSTEAEGGITKTLKLRQIEPEFLSRMFGEAV